MIIHISSGDHPFPTSLVTLVPVSGHLGTQPALNGRSTKEIHERLYPFNTGVTPMVSIELMRSTGRTGQCHSHSQGGPKMCVCEIRVRSEMGHRPEGIWLGQVIRSKIGVHLQTTGTQPSVGTFHSKPETCTIRESGDFPSRTHTRKLKPKPFLKLVKGFQSPMFFAVGARWRWSVNVSSWASRALPSHWGCSVPKVRHYHQNDIRRPKYRTPPFAGVTV